MQMNKNYTLQQARCHRNILIKLNRNYQNKFSKKIHFKDNCGVIGLKKLMSFQQMSCKNLGNMDTRVE